MESEVFGFRFEYIYETGDNDRFLLCVRGFILGVVLVCKVRFFGAGVCGL